MPTISDSNAVRDNVRIFPQHQAALTLLQAQLSMPGLNDLAWLDLACGRGQLISSLKSNLDIKYRSLIRFYGFDLDQNYARETERTAENLGFSQIEIAVGDLNQFQIIIDSSKKFDFITLTNTLHEVSPNSLPELLAHCLARLTSNGTLYLYDMETIYPPELGAIAWKRDEVRKILHKLLENLNVHGYRPEISWWPHRSTTGWSVAIEKKHFKSELDQNENSTNLNLSATQNLVSEILEAKKANCKILLEEMTKHGPETVEEEQFRENLLYDFWAIHRVLGEPS